MYLLSNTADICQAVTVKQWFSYYVYYAVWQQILYSVHRKRSASKYTDRKRRKTVQKPNRTSLPLLLKYMYCTRNYCVIKELKVSRHHCWR